MTSFCRKDILLGLIILVRTSADAPPPHLLYFAPVFRGCLEVHQFNETRVYLGVGLLFGKTTQYLETLRSLETFISVIISSPGSHPAISA